MTTVKKTETVKEIKEKLDKSKVIILTDYRGLKASQTEELRNKLREVNAEYQVTKNTLLARAAKEANLENLSEEALNGPTAVLFAYEDEVVPVKTLVNFIKNVETLKLKIGVMGNQILTVDKINALAKLPGRDILLGQVVGSLSSPIYNLAGVLQGNIRSLIHILNTVTQKRVGG